MVFKRRTPRTWLQFIAEGFWPKGGWNRAFYYVVHRLRRLPDPPHRIARGIAAGIFVCFTPFFGFHFLLAVVLAFLMQGNVVAALMATFVGNPLTFPFIAAISLELGEFILGQDSIPIQRVFGAFSRASQELWLNAVSVFTDEVAHWDRLERFWHDVFRPYMVGGLLPGLAASIVGYMLALPAVTAYQNRRVKKLRERYEKRRAALAKAAKRKGKGKAPAE
ncbi:DUF2062 domain-containing protein [Psychromarinibacter sp. C21-152]|uniref:DUF2062 domain-containing protein n=1 Tax=Psychromarinibacter sediminicola TaxID=3033385 RepID=A0AAE3NN45_9RHOB|nr:DUF2062 domain-containing protein [Psychromarinibacter sediminicola]MDF0599316.1 DUF2062 domain-containing protein [Psychromarinibacter sediminicola]